MKKFEAETQKIFETDNPLYKRKITVREKVASHINDRWIYSRYWTDENWVEQAKQDCEQRIDIVKRDLNNLMESMKLLENVEQ